MWTDDQVTPRPNADDALIGTQIGEYLVERHLGHGGMGIVFAGIHPVIKKPVAIKVLQQEIAREPGEVQRLLAEAQVVNAIRHRGIVDVIGFGKIPDGRPYLVMELLEGEPLDALVSRSAPLDPTLVATILGEMLEALGAAHGVGVIHRDLKPSNVFIVRPAHGDPYVKLLDFGLAKRAPEGTRHTPQTRASVVIGTPDYMAPEQARGRPVSPETDLYAVGCIAFEMLTGQAPFSATTIYEILAMHLNTPPPRVASVRPTIPPEIDELVDRLLRKAPEERPSSALGVRQELMAMREGWRLREPVGDAGQAALEHAATLRTLLPSMPEPPSRPVAEATKAAFASTVLPPSQAAVLRADVASSQTAATRTDGPLSQAGVMPVEVPVSGPTLVRRSAVGLWIALGTGLVLAVAAVAALSSSRTRPTPVPASASPALAGPGGDALASPPPSLPAPPAPGSLAPPPAPVAGAVPPDVPLSPGADADSAPGATPVPTKGRAGARKSGYRDPFESRH